MCEGAPAKQSDSSKAGVTISSPYVQSSNSVLFRYSESSFPAFFANWGAIWPFERTSFLWSFRGPMLFATASHYEKKASTL